MEFNGLNNLCSWEREKAMYLIKIAEELGMKLDGYGEIGVNSNSSYTYLWLEEYNFSLYMPINCDLTKKDVYVLWSNSEIEQEEEMVLGHSDLEEIEEWIAELENNFANSK